MSSVNKVMLVGYLGKTPEVRYLPDGTPVANISLATSESWKDKQTGEKNERTEWHRISLFGKLAEIAKQYLDKGSLVFFEGKLQTRKWQDKKSGEDRYTTEILAHEMKMLGGAQEKSNEDKKEEGIINLGKRPAPTPAPAPAGRKDHFADMVEDIPF